MDIPKNLLSGEFKCRTDQRERIVQRTRELHPGQSTRTGSAKNIVQDCLRLIILVMSRRHKPNTQRLSQSREKFIPFLTSGLFQRSMRHRPQFIAGDVKDMAGNTLTIRQVSDEFLIRTALQPPQAVVDVNDFKRCSIVGPAA